MYSWLPQAVALKTDLSDASWVVERLRPWGNTYPQPVACFLPDIFEAYARLLHPGREYWRRDDGSVALTMRSWSDLGARGGVDITAATRWEEVSAFGPQAGTSDDLDEPLEGTMPALLVELVARFVGGWTRTPGNVWFGMWEGNGTWWKGAHSVLSFGDDPNSTAEAHRIDDERDRVLRAAPTFGTPERKYFLMSGPLSAAPALNQAAGYRSPNLWWPDDRAWFISTEVDAQSTYVGGTASMIDALVASSDIEALPATSDSPVI